LNELIVGLTGQLYGKEKQKKGFQKIGQKAPFSNQRL
jgi:hypothetical protein